MTIINANRHTQYANHHVVPHYKNMQQLQGHIQQHNLLSKNDVIFSNLLYTKLLKVGRSGLYHISLTSACNLSASMRV